MPPSTQPCNLTISKGCKCDKSKPAEHCGICPRDAAIPLWYSHHANKRIFSAFCSAHTCGDWRASPGKRCTNPRQPPNGLCFEHTLCSSGCGRPSRPAEQIHCPSDECASPECHLARAQNSANCDAHNSVARCQYQRGQQRCSGTQLRNTPYCDVHRCNRERCTNPAVVTNGKCEFHVTCRTEGCPNPRVEKPNGGYESCCYEHMRGRCGQCNKEIPLMDAFCDKHACGFRRCSRRKAEDPNHPFCESHTCTSDKCCRSVASFENASSTHCTEHECAEPKCYNESKTPKGFCVKDHACLADECETRRAVVPNGTKYCGRHKCMEDGCKEAALTRGGHLRFCQAYHACKDDECPERRSERSPNTTYCTIHECKEPECTWKARKSQDYCTQFHACADSTCGRKRDDTLEGTKHCLLHKCQDDKCVVQARSSGGYCEQTHACKGKAGSCPQARASAPAGTNFCDIHRCKSDGCLAERRDAGGYCENLHACMVLLCMNPRTTDPQKGGRCWEHFTEHLKEHFASENAMLKKKTEEVEEERERLAAEEKDRIAAREKEEAMAKARAQGGLFAPLFTTSTSRSGGSSANGSSPFGSENVTQVDEEVYPSKEPEFRYDRSDIRFPASRPRSEEYSPYDGSRGHPDHYRSRSRELNRDRAIPRSRAGTPYIPGDGPDGRRRDDGPSRNDWPPRDVRFPREDRPSSRDNRDDQRSRERPPQPSVASPGGEDESSMYGAGGYDFGYK